MLLLRYSLYTTFEVDYLNKIQSLTFFGHVAPDLDDIFVMKRVINGHLHPWYTCLSERVNASIPRWNTLGHLITYAVRELLGSLDRLSPARTDTVAYILLWLTKSASDIGQHLGTLLSYH